MTGPLRHLLIVEDNADDLALMLRALDRNAIRCEVRVARDGAQALDHLLPSRASDGAPPSLPAVVLLDLKLPEIDGLGVLRRIRSHQRTLHVPVVILTSSDEPVDLVNSYQLGANSFIRKPVGFANLVDVMRQVKEYWLQVNRVPDPVDAGR